MSNYGITCQDSFDAEATMQSDDGVYLCSECWINTPDKTGDIIPCCGNCKHDGYQLVERKCLHCKKQTYSNFEAKT